VENPLRSEGAAFQFVLLTIGFLGAIVIASAVLGAWAGLVVFVAGAGAGVWRLLLSRRR
jgi:hypothetical protein